MKAGLIVAALAVLVAVALLSRPRSRDTPLTETPIPQPIIAVLPPIDLAGGGNEYFNDGLASEIAAGL
ncbi:MAG: hypothetical protein ACE5FP_04430, partial [Gemmatimonadota bacterium]